MHLSAKEAICIYKKGCAARCTASAKIVIIKSILAGIMIGMGAAASSVAAHAVSNVGIARLVAAVVFPVGLMMVILLGAELFTGDCLMVVGLMEKDIMPIQFIRMLTLVYFGNLIGSIILVCLVVLSGQLASLNVRNMIFNNLIPVTIGNIVGGCCFVALPIYYINRNKVAVNNAKEETEYVRQHNDCVSGIAR